MINNITSTDRLALVWALLYSSPIVKLMVIQEVQAKTVAIVEEQDQVIVAELSEEDTMEVEEQIEDSSGAVVGLWTPEHSTTSRVLIILSNTHPQCIERADKETVVYLPNDHSIFKNDDVVNSNQLFPYPYHISVDTMNIKALLTLEQQQELEKQLIGSFRYEKIKEGYYQVFYDDAYGVTLYYKPYEPYRSAIYTFSLFRHGYSHNSSLLKMLLQIVPTCQLRVSRIDVAIDLKASINEVFVALPTTNLRMHREKNTVYFGSEESSHRMVCYDKQLQLRASHGIDLDACTRLEYRQAYNRMKPLDELRWSDVQESKKYSIVHSIAQYERCYKEQYNQFITDPNFVKQSLNQAQRRELRKYTDKYRVGVYDIFNCQAQQNSLLDLIHRPYDITQVFKAS